MRQFFMDSHYWASTCLVGTNYCKSFTPSAALIKAVLMTSCQPVPTYSIPQYDPTNKVDSMNLGAPPDIYQGECSSRPTPLSLSTSLVSVLELNTLDHARIKKLLSTPTSNRTSYFRQ